MNQTGNNATRIDLSGFTLWFIAVAYIKLFVMLPLYTLSMMRHERLRNEGMSSLIHIMTFLNALSAPLLVDFLLFAFAVTNWSPGNVIAACLICAATLGSAYINSKLATLDIKKPSTRIDATRLNESTLQHT